MAQTSVAMLMSTSSLAEQVYCSTTKSGSGSSGIIEPGCEAGQKVASSASAVESLLRKHTKSAVRTLQNRDIQIKEDFQTALQLKRILAGSALNADDIKVVAGGKLLQDEDNLSLQDLSILSKKCFAFVKTSSKSTLNAKFHDSKTKGTTTTSFSVSARVFHVKRELFQRKITSLRPEEQRIIVGSKVLSDSAVIGDYLLGQSKYNHQQLNFYISQMTNTKQEINVDVCVTFARDPKMTINLGLGISQPLSMLNTHMVLHHGLPPPNPMFTYIYTMISHTGEPLILDDSKSLLDYGITKTLYGAGTRLQMRMYQLLMPRKAPNPVFAQIDNYHNLFMLNAIIKADAKILSIKKDPIPEFKTKGADAIKTVLRAYNLNQNTESQRSSVVSEPAPPKQKQQPFQPKSQSRNQTATMPPNTRKRPSSSNCGMFKGMKRGFLGSSNSKSVMAAVKPANTSDTSHTSTPNVTPSKSKP